jgi:hypothetical protein
VQVDLLERGAAGVRAGEGNVAGRVPVLRGHHVTEAARAQQRVDRRHDRVALVAGQRAAGHEVRLQVDHDQGGVAQVDAGHAGRA